MLARKVLALWVVVGYSLRHKIRNFLAFAVDTATFAVVAATGSACGHWLVATATARMTELV
ncbi:MAG: hypothetical protein DWI25_04080 [Planctomycetota bacterium]|nr:MAG: hypothetical protein DWI25_04080 [Planctomycetota bacterium]